MLLDKHFRRRAFNKHDYLFNELHVDIDSLAGAEVAEEPDEPLLRLSCLNVGAPDPLVVGVSGLTDFLSSSLHATMHRQNQKLVKR